MQYLKLECKYKLKIALSGLTMKTEEDVNGISHLQIFEIGVSRIRIEKTKSGIYATMKASPSLPPMNHLPHVRGPVSGSVSARSQL